MDGTNVTGLCATYDSRKETQAYEIQLFKRTPLSVGDEVRIVYHPLSIEADTRIVGIGASDTVTVLWEAGKTTLLKIYSAPFNFFHTIIFSSHFLTFPL